MTVLYVDLSHHDWDRVKGEFDWARIKAATSPVLCLRATYGDPAGYNPTTRHFGDMATGARRAGFDLIGGYHNLINGDQASINRQVDYFRRTLDAQGADAAMADIEPYPELVKNGLWPRWDAVRRFHDRWYSVEDRVCAWYIAEWFWTVHPGPDLGAPDLRVLRGPLVQSHYAGGDGTAAQIYAAAGGDKGTGWDDRYGNRLPDVWQFTSSANVPGASGSTDVNAFRGTLDQLRALLTNQPQGDDMGLDNTTPLYRGGPTERVALGDLHYAEFKGNMVSVVQQALAAAKLREEAILDAIKGVDTAAILARIDQVAQADAERDADLRALVQQAASGELDAVEVVRLIGERLATGATPQA